MKDEYTTNFPPPHLHVSFKRWWENVLFELRSERVNSVVDQRRLGHRTPFLWPTDFAISANFTLHVTHILLESMWAKRPLQSRGSLLYSWMTSCTSPSPWNLFRICWTQREDLPSTAVKVEPCQVYFSCQVIHFRCCWGYWILDSLFQESSRHIVFLVNFSVQDPLLCAVAAVQVVNHRLLGDLWPWFWRFRCWIFCVSSGRVTGMVLGARGSFCPGSFSKTTWPTAGTRLRLRRSAKPPFHGNLASSSVE